MLNLLFYIQVLFESIDVNKDGMISREEWVFANMDYFFNSGPENANSLFFGTLPDDDWWLHNELV